MAGPDGTPSRLAERPRGASALSTLPGMRREPGALAAELARAIPGLRGSLAADAPMAPLSWFRTGGPAEFLFTPAGEADLALFLAGCPAEVPVLV
ncbi:MAG: UDP-N-acetylenolpyruvoylglucosamine reductase, partial [Enterovirga sp.]|nr:UDP-N-acetylenolpyruvoylglucosamine reductase [Enterovirga sp.]